MCKKEKCCAAICVCERVEWGWTKNTKMWEGEIGVTKEHKQIKHIVKTDISQVSNNFYIFLK